jgi:hypothetical protein
MGSFVRSPPPPCRRALCHWRPPPPAVTSLTLRSTPMPCPSLPHPRLLGLQRRPSRAGFSLVHRRQKEAPRPPRVSQACHYPSRLQTPSKVAGPCSMRALPQGAYRKGKAPMEGPRSPRQLAQPHPPPVAQLRVG